MYIGVGGQFHELRSYYLRRMATVLILQLTLHHDIGILRAGHGLLPLYCSI